MLLPKDGTWRKERAIAATVQLRLPGTEGKAHRGEVEIVDPTDFEEFRGRLGFV